MLSQRSIQQGQFGAFEQGHKIIAGGGFVPPNEFTEDRFIIDTGVCQTADIIGSDMVIHTRDMDCGNKARRQGVMTKLPYRVDETAAKADAMLNDPQRRKIESVDLSRKPHLTWHEYQWCLQLSSKRARQQFLRLKRGEVTVNAFFATNEFDRKRTPVIVHDEFDLRPGGINHIRVTTDKPPQNPSRLQCLINFFKRATRANKPT